MQSVNILAISNGVGISKDIEIIKSLLENNGFEVYVNHTFRFKPERNYDLGIHLERFNPHIIPVNRKNIMIPNQEWFDKLWLGGLNLFDAFLVKTKYAEDIFKKLGVLTYYTGFTSEDRLITEQKIQKDYFHWIHVAGKSIQKQTEIVIRTWEKNPGFPQLTIIQDQKFWKPRTLCRNINYMIDRVPDGILKMIQNISFVHVCPSETEGFGHYIMEAMSVGSLPLVTDAPPMNELVDGSRGILIRHVREEPMNLSTKYIIDEKTLEDAVIKMMVIDEGKKKDMAKESREFFLRNDAEFKANFINSINEVMS